jgi:RND family efflux transporter MFP subunit
MRALNKFFSMSRRQQLVVLLILALLMFVVFRIVQAKTLASRAKAPEVTAIQIKTSEIIQLQSTSFDKTLSLSGALDPYQQAVVSARASGEVQEVRVREGQTVKKDEVLAQLVTTTYQAQVNQASAAVESAKQSLLLAQNDFANNEALFKSGFIAKMALQRFEVARQNAQSNLTNAQQSLVIAQRGLSDTKIIAPIAGVVAARKINTGETVGSGTVLFSIVNESSFELAAPISAEQIGSLSVGQTVQLSATGVSQAFTGTVERINPAAQAGSRSYTTYIRVNNPGNLRAGMFAQGQVLLSSRPDILSLPATAIHSKDNQKFVYVFANNTLTERAVTTGERTSDAIDAPVEITSGLTTGESVVRLDLGNIKPDLQVTLIDEKAAQAPESASKPSGVLAKIKAWLTQK